MAEQPPTTEERVSDGGHLDDDLLSAYLNADAHDPAERQRIEAHLAGCERCRRALAGLRVVVSQLQALPSPAPSRSFRLTPAMVPLRVVVPDPWFIRFQPGLRRLTAVAALLLVMVVSADLVSHEIPRESARRETPTPALTTGASSVATASGGGAEKSASSAAQSAADSAAAPSATNVGNASGAVSGRSAGSAASPAAAAAMPQMSSTGPSSTPAAAQPGAASAASAATALPTVAPTLSPEPTAAPATPFANAAAPPTGRAQAGPSSTASHAVWRLIELGLFVVTLWLLVAATVLPRIGRYQPPRA
jgi:hypothetical protein